MFSWKSGWRRSSFQMEYGQRLWRSRRPIAVVVATVVAVVGFVVVVVVVVVVRVSVLIIVAIAVVVAVVVDGGGAGVSCEKRGLSYDAK